MIFCFYSNMNAWLQILRTVPDQRLHKVQNSGGPGPWKFQKMLNLQVLEGVKVINLHYAGKFRGAIAPRPPSCTGAAEFSIFFPILSTHHNPKAFFVSRGLALLQWTELFHEWFFWIDRSPRYTLKFGPHRISLGQEWKWNKYGKSVLLKITKLIFEKCLSYLLWGRV